MGYPSKDSRLYKVAEEYAQKNGVSVEDACKALGLITLEDTLMSNLWHLRTHPSIKQMIARGHTPVIGNHGEKFSPVLYEALNVEQGMLYAQNNFDNYIVLLSSGAIRSDEL